MLWCLALAPALRRLCLRERFSHTTLLPLSSPLYNLAKSSPAQNWPLLWGPCTRERAPEESTKNEGAKRSARTKRKWFPGGKNNLLKGDVLLFPLSAFICSSSSSSTPFPFFGGRKKRKLLLFVEYYYPAKFACLQHQRICGAAEENKHY